MIGPSSNSPQETWTKEFGIRWPDVEFILFITQMSFPPSLKHHLINPEVRSWALNVVYTPLSLTHSSRICWTPGDMYCFMTFSFCTFLALAVNLHHLGCSFKDFLVFCIFLRITEFHIIQVFTEFLIIFLLEVHHSQFCGDAGWYLVFGVFSIWLA